MIPDGADAAVRTAADELRTYIRRISGAQLPCVTQTAYTPGMPAIVLDDREPALRADGFRIRSDGTTLRTSGADSRFISLRSQHSSASRMTVWLV